MEKKIHQSQDMKNTLEKQIEGKRNKNRESLSDLSKTSGSTGFKFSCDHGNDLVPCSICSRKYPKNMISKSPSTAWIN
jgi:hypothetical protein